MKDEKFTEKTENVPIQNDSEVIGDIDELIFPDDEAYYISER